MTRKLNDERSENNQPFYVGIDVHKKHWSICLIDRDEIVGQFKIPCQRLGLLIHLAENIRHASIVAYERKMT
jgi:hypothetical protein